MRGRQILVATTLLTLYSSLSACSRRSVRCFLVMIWVSLPKSLHLHHFTRSSTTRRTMRLVLWYQFSPEEPSSVPVLLVSWQTGLVVD